MHRQDLLNKLQAYSPEFEIEKEFRASFLSFIETNTDCFERSLQEGHITGSAWILNAAHDKALLTHHQKLNRWLQLGGHADGECDVMQVALKEAKEESGLTQLKLLSETIFDIDIHTIPGRENEPEHLHYDIRFLFEADDSEKLVLSSESKALAWVPLDELKEVTASNDSILRMALKSDQWRL